MDNPVTLELKNDLAELGLLGETVDAFGDENGLLPKLKFNLNLALDELVTNIISYGYEDDREHTITLRLGVMDGELTAQLEDDARPFDPLQRPAPDTTLPVESRPIGGLGIYFMRKTMDSVDYRRENGRNLLTMKVRIDREE